MTAIGIYQTREHYKLSPRLKIKRRVRLINKKIQIRLVFPDPPRLFGYRQKNHEKINSSRKNRLKKSMTRRYPKRRGGSGNTSLREFVYDNNIFYVKIKVKPVAVHQNIGSFTILA